MAFETGIEWTNHTWNPWRGCQHVSPGCDNCYMYRGERRYGRDPQVVVRSKTTFYDPLKWRDAARVFTCSLSDFFIKEADAWRLEAWEIMRRTPHLQYQVLTKRPSRMRDWAKVHGWLPNVWAGTSVENEKYLYRLDVLARVPATIRFISAEPLLASLDLRRWLYNGTLQWVIVGGESGPGARPLDIGWVRFLRDQCAHTGTPLFVKQLGTRWARARRASDTKGSDVRDWPADLNIREYPDSQELAWRGEVVNALP